MNKSGVDGGLPIRAGRIIGQPWLDGQALAFRQKASIDFSGLRELIAG
jgi:hypothetical protein